MLTVINNQLRCARMVIFDKVTETPVFGENGEETESLAGGLRNATLSTQSVQPPKAYTNGQLNPPVHSETRRHYAVRMQTQKEFVVQMAGYLCTPLESYVKSDTRTPFHCNQCGQTFTSSHSKITTRRQPGQPGCSSCFKLIAKDQRAEKWTATMRAFAAARGGELITPRITQIKDRVTFRCTNRHEWEASAEAVKNLKTWCPVCAGNAMRNLDDLLDIVKARQGRLLSDEYRGVDATYEFECVLGHRFRNMFRKVEKGQWCPTCNKGRISEEISRTTMEQLFGIAFPKERPNWLRNSRGRLMELDGANLDLGIAFEYHGVQHFKKNLYIKEDDKLRQRQQDDKHKEKLCREHGIALVVLTYEIPHAEFPKHIRQQLVQHGLDISGIDFDKAIDLTRAYVREDRIVELRELLAPKQIEVLTAAWQGVQSSYEFRCLVCGHEWKAKGQSFFNSRSVSGCNACSRRKAGDKHRLTLDDLRTFADARGGQLQSDTYTRRNAYYRWRCKAGHEFNGNYNNMAHRNQFCPACDGRTPRPRKPHLTTWVDRARPHDSDRQNQNEVGKRETAKPE